MATFEIFEIAIFAKTFRFDFQTNIPSPPFFLTRDLKTDQIPAAIVDSVFSGI